MEVFGYIVGHDFGFAPNPFGGTCSLACCKGRLREAVRKLVQKTPDEHEIYVVGMGSGKSRLKMTGRCIWWMRVQQITDFKSYYEDPRFQFKKPLYGGSTSNQFGDNIYQWDENISKYKQHRSFHSHRDGSCNLKNYRPDTRSDAVLLSNEFGYFGSSAPELPFELREEFTLKGLRDMRRHFSADGKRGLVSWLKAQGLGYQGDPASWGKLKTT